MHIPLLTEAQAAKRGAKAPLATQGDLVKGKISAILPTHMDVTLDLGSKGRVYLCEVQEAEEAAKGGAKGFEGYAVGQSIEAVCFGPVESSEGRKQRLQDLSLRPAVVEAAEKKEKVAPFRMRARRFKPGQTVYG